MASSKSLPREEEEEEEEGEEAAAVVTMTISAIVASASFEFWRSSRYTAPALAYRASILVGEREEEEERRIEDRNIVNLPDDVLVLFCFRERKEDSGRRRERMAEDV